jgi:hypothetical protein
MTDLLVNGTNMDSVVANGTSIDEVYANGALVWRRFILADNVGNVYKIYNYVGGQGFVYLWPDGSTTSDVGGGSWGLPITTDIGDDYDVKFTYSLPADWSKSAATPSSGSWVRLDAARGLTVNNNINFDNETTMSVSYAIRRHGTTTTLFTSSFDITLIYEDE